MTQLVKDDQERKTKKKIYDLYKNWIHCEISKLNRTKVHFYRVLEKEKSTVAIYLRNIWQRCAEYFLNGCQYRCTFAEII